MEDALALEPYVDILTVGAVGTETGEDPDPPEVPSSTLRRTEVLRHCGVESSSDVKIE